MKWASLQALPFAHMIENKDTMDKVNTVENKDARKKVTMVKNKDTMEKESMVETKETVESSRTPHFGCIHIMHIVKKQIFMKLMF